MKFRQIGSVLVGEPKNPGCSDVRSTLLISTNFVSAPSHEKVMN